MKNIYFDMDGTLANFYGVENWLDYLLNEDTYPYENAKPLFNFSALAKRIHKMERKGFTFSIISWGSKESSDEYLQAVTEAKVKWLEKHLPSVKFADIKVVHYGTPKSLFRVDESDILFDDEERNRIDWGEASYSEQNLLEVLKELANS